MAANKPSREAWLTAARSYLGLEPTDPVYVQRVYLAHLPGGGTPLQRAQAQQMARAQSGCGLVWEAIARDQGVAWPHLRRWYGERGRLGTAISANVGQAKKDGAWITPGGGRLPLPGDALVIGGPAPQCSRGGITYEHMLTMLALSPDGVLTSVDGGQPGVGERSRVLVQTPQGELWLANVPPGGGAAQLGPDGRPLVGRRVQGWIDVDRLPYSGAPPVAPLPPEGGPGAPFSGGYSPGGGTAGGGGATDSYGGECPPCPEPAGLGLGRAAAWLLLAFLLGELTGQHIEEQRPRRRRGKIRG